MSSALAQSCSFSSSGSTTFQHLFGCTSTWQLPTHCGILGLRLFQSEGLVLPPEAVCSHVCIQVSSNFDKTPQRASRVSRNARRPDSRAATCLLYELTRAHPGATSLSSHENCAVLAEGEFQVMHAATLIVAGPQFEPGALPRDQFPRFDLAWSTRSPVCSFRCWQLCLPVRTVDIPPHEGIEVAAGSDSKQDRCTSMHDRNNKNCQLLGQSDMTTRTADFVLFHAELHTILDTVGVGRSHSCSGDAYAGFEEVAGTRRALTRSNLLCQAVVRDEQRAGLLQKYSSLA